MTTNGTPRNLVSPTGKPTQVVGRLGEACRSCGEPIRWFLTITGRRIPIDPTPHPAGTVIRITDENGRVRARVLTGNELPAQETAWRDHRATCTRIRAGPRCTRCQGLLDPDVAEAEPWHTTHPTCDPGA